MEKCPLTGQPCPHRKPIHITDVTDEGVKALSLCEPCAAGYLDPKKPVVPDFVQKHSELLFELFEKLFNAVMKNKLPTESTAQPPVITESVRCCPHCGITIEEIARVGRLGCPRCYEFFGQELESVLRQAHMGNTKHVGKIPKNWLKQKQELEAQEKEKAVQKQLQSNPRPMIEEQIRSLEEKMANCIKLEHYEVAASLRDTIKELKAQLGES